jgi:hypothetical protein
MALKIVKVPNAINFVVVAFDICSSSDIIEELTLKGDMKRFQQFLTAIKRHLMEKQKTITFVTYKFTGDGWILLFPENTDGKVLLKFLKDLCVFFRKELRSQILRYLDTPPGITGLTFGLEKGPLGAMLMYGKTEYVGRSLNIACRLQSAVKDKGGSPAYKALVSNAVFNDYLEPAKNFRIFKVKRTLRNIRGGVAFRCRKIELLPSSSTT